MSSFAPISSSSRTTFTAAAVIAAAAVTTGTTATLVTFWWWRRRLQQHQQHQSSNNNNDKALRQAQERRQEERTGRIRAEVKLRQVSKELAQLQQQQQQQAATTQQNGSGSSNNNRQQQSTTTTMLLKLIGTVTSPYTKRMGTPRQPQLVPSSRGFIEFTCPAAALDGIAEYSHVWILFEFHANTNHHHHHTGSAATTTNKATKIRPPRASGLKVGQLATRSPHRPNPLGLSLVQVHAFDPKTRRLHVRGLDLVHGTPVYDIKPCVPWDVPSTPLRVPAWVSSDDDALPCVTLAPQAEADLTTRIVDEQRLAPLYTADNDGVAAARQTLVEILTQDPRSSHKGLQANARGTWQSSSLGYHLVFGKCQVVFRVLQQQQPEDAAVVTVVVERIDPIDFDNDSTIFADGVPLIMANKNNNSEVTATNVLSS